MVDNPNPYRRPLSPRQSDIAIMVAEGLSNRRIAELLQINEQTVYVQMQHILARTGLANRWQLIDYIRKSGNRRASESD